VTRRQRAHPPAHDSTALLKSAYSLALNVVLTSALGLGFWIVAARIFPSSTVGRDAALVAAMTTLSAICQLNFAAAIPRFLPIVRDRPERVVWGSYLLTGLVSVLGAIAFVLVAPAVSSSYRFLSTQPALALLFVASVVVWGVFSLEDAVLTAARRAVWVPVENTIFGVLKIAALPVMLSLASGHPVFIAWNAPVVALVIPVNLFIFLRVLRKPIAISNRPTPIERFGLRGLLRFLAQDYLAFVFAAASSGLLPVLVVALLGGSSGAYFYMPFALIAAFDSLFALVVQPLTVEGALAEARLPELTRDIVRHFGWLLVVGIILLAGGASHILALYGADYARKGAPLLRLLALASLFRAITGVYMAICRVEGRASRILGTQVATLVLLVVLVAVLAPSHGLVGVGLAWLIASVVVAAATVWHVIGVLRRLPRDPHQASHLGPHVPPVPPSPPASTAEVPGGDSLS
jgi:O-antigen/teichoic acid export membrane protein